MISTSHRLKILFSYCLAIAIWINVIYPPYYPALAQNRPISPLSGELIEKIVDAVESLYHDQASGTIVVLVKRFNFSDKETYAIVEALNDFLIIDLIKDPKGQTITEIFISKDLRLNKVKPALVEEVRKDPIIFVICK